jgi:hypothetical protein
MRSGVNGSCAVMLAWKVYRIAFAPQRVRMLLFSRVATERRDRARERIAFIFNSI